MKVFHKSLGFIMAVSLALGGTASASEQIDEIGTGDVGVDVDGEWIDFDVSPVIKNGRVFIPMRKVSEVLGAEVDWNQSKKLISAKRGNTNINLTVGSKNVTINGKTTNLDVAPFIDHGRALVPLRVMSEAFGATVEWDAHLRAVRILSNFGYLAEGEPITYINRDYGFSLELPAHWEGNYEVEDHGIESGNPVIFYYNLGDNSYPVFQVSFVHSPQPANSQDPYKHIVKGGGHLYGYEITTKPATELADNNLNDREKLLYMRLVNDEMPKIANTVWYVGEERGETINQSGAYEDQTLETVNDFRNYEGLWANVSQDYDEFGGPVNVQLRANLEFTGPNRVKVSVGTTLPKFNGNSMEGEMEPVEVTLDKNGEGIFSWKDLNWVGSGTGTVKLRDGKVEITLNHDTTDYRITGIEQFTPLFEGTEILTIRE